MTREENILIFQDTMNLCHYNPALVHSIHTSIINSQVVLQGEPVSPSRDIEKSGRISITSRRSFEEAFRHRTGRTCVLNFANAFHGGGGVKEGSSAQEESLCRISTLYPCLMDERIQNEYYRPHLNDPHFEGYDDCIWTPDVTVFKRDDGTGELLQESKWMKCDVITCAAPDLMRHPDYPDENLSQLIKARTRRILEICACHHEDTVILGAFGCGAFCCNPECVSRSMLETAMEVRNWFEDIVFAIYANHRDDHNYAVFQNTLQQIQEERKEREEEKKTEDALQRFQEAQTLDYSRALAEIRNGKKQSHWMWYIFPQIHGLGKSSTSRYYALQSLEEARLYLEDEMLGSNLLEICHALMDLKGNDPHAVFGSPDDCKLRSSMTLFEKADPQQKVFSDVMEKYFHGERDPRTLEILKNDEIKK